VNPRRIAAGTLLASACASVPGEPAPRGTLLDPALNVGTMGERTRFEREMARPFDDNSPARPPSKVTPALMWTGVVLGVVGGAMALGFGAASYTADRKLTDGYAGDGLTVAEEDRLRDRGSTYDKVAAAGGGLGVLGLGLASVTFTVDYIRCGSLAPKRRKCAQRH
jgi:hypothetical protein